MAAVIQFKDCFYVHVLVADYKVNVFRLDFVAICKFPLFIVPGLYQVKQSNLWADHKAPNFGNFPQSLIILPFIFGKERFSLIRR